MHIIIPVVFKHSVIVDEERILNRRCMYTDVTKEGKFDANVPNFDRDPRDLRGSFHLWMKRSFLESRNARNLRSPFVSKPIAPKPVGRD